MEFYKKSIFSRTKFQKSIVVLFLLSVFFFPAFSRAQFLSSIEEYASVISAVDSIIQSLRSILFELEGSLYASLIGDGSGLGAYWKFDEGSGTAASDSSGSGNNGVLINGPLWASGKVGSALSFDGVDDRINLGNSAELKPSAGTIAAWVRPRTAGFGFVFSVNNTTQDRFGGLYWSLASRKFGFIIYNAGSLLYFDTSGQFDLNQWYHVVVICGSGNKIYVNGVQQAVTYTTGTSATNSCLDDITSADREFIGARNKNNEGANAFFPGLIDEVRVYNRTLSAGEILQLYNDGTSTTPLLPPSPPSPSLDAITWLDALANLGNNSWLEANPAPRKVYQSWVGRDGTDLCLRTITDGNPIRRDESGLILGDANTVFSFGGGHESHTGNDVDLYFIDQNRWEVQLPPECPLPGSPEYRVITGSGSGTANITPLGRPYIQHTYQRTAWDPIRQRFVSVLLSGKATWEFKPATKQWKVLAGPSVGTFSPEFEISAGIVLYDPVSDKIIAIVRNARIGQKGVSIYNSITNKWSFAAPFPPDVNLSGRLFGAYNPDLKEFYIHDEGYPSDITQKFFRYRPATHEWSKITSVPAELTVPYGSFKEGTTMSANFDYDTANKKLVFLKPPLRYSALPPVIWVWDPVTDIWERLPTPPLVPPALLGSNRNFVYVPSQNVFVNVISLNYYCPEGSPCGGRTKTWVYRLAGGGISTPTLTFTANPVSVTQNSAAMLYWSSAGVNSCTASDSWSGSKPLSGSESTGPLTSSQTYTLNCTGSRGTVARSVTVTVTPSDSIKPDVSITSPSNGATVSGTTTVIATANDNVGVTGVQFKLDGNNLGAEDTAFPYSIFWNTTSTTNGAHTLTAVAHDAAGNTKISSEVSVTVSNAVASPTLTVSPTTLSFSAVVGSSPLSQTISISNTGGGTMNWTASDNASWLTLSSASGMNSSSITTLVSTTGLSAGTYSGIVTITAPGASGSPKTVNVTLTVTPPSPVGSDIPLTIIEPIGVARTNEPVTSGIPLPPGTQTTNWALFDDTTEIPIHVTKLQGTALWILLDFQISIPANGAKVLTLKQQPRSVSTPIMKTSFRVSNLKIVDGTTNQTWNAIKDNETWEYEGPMRSVLRVDGHYKRDDGTSVPGFTYSTRYTYYAGKPYVKIEHILKNSLQTNERHMKLLSASLNVDGGGVQARVPSTPVGSPVVVNGPATVELLPMQQAGMGATVALNGGYLLYDLTHYKATVFYDPSGEMTVRKVEQPLMALADASWYSQYGGLTTSRFGTFDDEKMTYKKWGWTWNVGNELEISNQRRDIYLAKIAVHQDSESDDLWQNLLMYLRTGKYGYFIRSQEWGGYFTEDYPFRTDGFLYAWNGDGERNPVTRPLVSIPLTTADSFYIKEAKIGKVDSQSSPIDHIYGWGLLDWYQLTGERDALKAAEDLGEISIRFHGQRNPSEKWLGQARGIGRNLLLTVRLWEATQDPKWKKHANHIVDLILGYDGWRESWGMYELKDQDDVYRVPASFQLAALHHALDRYNTNFPNTEVSRRMLKMSEFAKQYAMHPVWGHAPQSIILDSPAPGQIRYLGRGGVTWNDTTEPIVNPHDTIGWVDIITRGYRMTGDISYLDRAKTLWAHGSRTGYLQPATSRYVGPNQVGRFMNGKLGSEKHYFSLNGDILYVHLFFYDAAREGSGNDTTPPSVPANLHTTAVTSNQVVLTWNPSTDDRLVTGYKIFRNETQIGTSVSTSYTDSTVSPSTTYIYTVAAYDAAGNISAQSASVSVTTQATSDTQAPSVSITAPTSGVTVSGSAVTVSANATDNVGVAGVQFKLDGVNLGAEDTTSPYSITWNTTSVPNGSHSLTAVARDAAGNTGVSGSVSVAVNNIGIIAPTVTLSVSPATITSGGSATLTWSSTSATSCTASGAWSGTKTTSGTQTVNPTVTSTYTLTCTGSGGSATQSVTVTVSTATDTTPPTVSITAPIAGATVSGSAVTTTANATDNVGVVGVQFKFDGLLFGAEDTSSPYTIVWDSTTVANGPHIIAAVARDAAGNRATTTIPVIVSNIVISPDTVPPAVSITMPASGSVLSGSSLVRASATDAVGVVGVQFLLDGAPLGAEDSSPPYEVILDTTAIANGEHSLSAVARDLAGNKTTATPVVININNPILTIPDLVLSNISATGITQSAATIIGTTNIQARFLLEYGITASYGNRIGTTTSFSASASFPLTGLSPSTTYHYRLSAQDTAGHFILSADQLFTTTAVSVAIPIFTTGLFFGISHPQVLELQRLLIKEGLLTPDSTTGYFGPLTLSAVQRFQCKYAIVCGGTPESNGYGFVGPATRKKLNVLSGVKILPQETSPISVTFTRNLFKGLRGEDVRRLQQILIKKGFLATGLDTGYYGSFTEAAVKKYQASVKLPQTGYFGPLTRARIAQP